ncbi:MAG: phosphoribosylglycinamide formyltransferase [Candidatus Lernaella stagnicola]|nr:phosphoribosylglycinamide formyltransferase [Candidatus Lernaella stagnicola]
MSAKLKLAVFLSGGGSNFEAIAENCAAGKIACEVVVVFSNRADAYGLERARKFGIDTVCLDDREFPSRAAHEAASREALAPFKFDLIVLAGYMRLMTAAFIADYRLKKFDLPGVINIHPADTAVYQGVHGYEFAMGLTKKGPRLTETKISVHFIDAGMDTGPLIAQRPVPVLPEDDLDAVKERGLAVEWELYSAVLDAIARGKVRVQDGRYTIVDDSEA